MLRYGSTATCRRIHHVHYNSAVRSRDSESSLTWACGISKVQGCSVMSCCTSLAPAQVAHDVNQRCAKRFSLSVHQLLIAILPVAQLCRSLWARLRFCHRSRRCNAGKIDTSHSTPAHRRRCVGACNSVCSFMRMYSNALQGVAAGTFNLSYMCTHGGTIITNRHAASQGRAS